MTDETVVLYHYTDLPGFVGIWKTAAQLAEQFANGEDLDGGVQQPFPSAIFHMGEALFLSKKTAVRKDAHAGEGVYFSEIPPGSLSASRQLWSMYSTGANKYFDRCSHWFSFEIPVERTVRYRANNRVVRKCDRRWLQFLHSGRNPSYPFSIRLPSRGALSRSGRRDLVLYGHYAIHKTISGVLPGIDQLVAVVINPPYMTHHRRSAVVATAPNVPGHVWRAAQWGLGSRATRFAHLTPAHFSRLLAIGVAQPPVSEPG